MKSITPQELKFWMDEQRPFVLVDVREPFEREAFSIGGIHIPLGEIMQRREELRSEQPVIIYCEKGIRSGIVIQRLEGLGFSNLVNLEGGMTAWKAM